MPKEYVLIIDDNDEYVVLPHKWLNIERKEYFWPDHEDDPVQLIIDNVDVEDNWKLYSYTKYIKSAVSYPEAVADMKNFGANIDVITDASDDQKLKSSRSERHKLVKEDFVTSNTENSNKRKRLESLENNDNDDVDTSTDKENDKSLDKCIERNMKSTEKKVSSKNGPNILSSIRLSNKLNVENILKSSRKTNNIAVKTEGKTADKTADKHAAKPAAKTATNTATKTAAKTVETTDSTTDKAINKTADKTNVKITDNTSCEYVDEETCSVTDILKIVLGNQKLMIEKLNVLSTRVKNIEGNLSNKSSSISSSAALSHNHLKILSKYFQIDEDEKLLDTVEEKLENEKFYTLVYTHIQNIGGNTPKAHLDSIMKYLISDKVLTEYSYTGQSKRENLKNKSFMNLKLHNLIFYCMKTTYANRNIEEKEIKKYISSYLDSASTRIARAQLKTSKSSDKVAQPLHFNLSDIADYEEDD